MVHNEKIQYGDEGEISVEFESAEVVEHRGQPCGEAFDDPIAAVAAALVSPKEFPPLTEAIVAGDRIVIAVGEAIPQINQVLDAVIQTVVDGGVQPENIIVLMSGDDSTIFDRVHVEQFRDVVEVIQHNPRGRMDLAYLASTETGHAVYMNRHILDADFVITLGCMRPKNTRGYFGVHSSVYPAFADIDTIRRFRSRSSGHGKQGIAEVRKLSREVDEAGWLLGARFTIQLIPGAGDSILHVLSGDVDVVNDEGSRLSKKAWTSPITQRFDLVVAAVPGNAAQQTWQNLYRALEAASRAVTDDGAIAICTQLDRPLDELTLRALAGTNSTVDAKALEAKHANGDALSDDVPVLTDIEPRKLFQSLDNVSVCLLSALEDQLVEEMGMMPISKPDEVKNLCRQHERCLILSNAQHVWPEVLTGASSTA